MSSSVPVDLNEVDELGRDDDENGDTVEEFFS